MNVFERGGSGGLGTSLCLAVVLASWPPPGVLTAALVSGDVVVVGVNADNPDAVAWVPLVDLPAGQRLYFSDAGWIGDRFSGQVGASSDGAIEFVAPAGGVAAGLVQSMDLGELSSRYQPVTGLAGNNFSLATTGDQLVVFSGSPGAPNFLFAVNFASSEWTLTGGSSSNNIRSELYPGLTDGQTAVALGTGPHPGDEFDNVLYTGPTVGSRAELLAAVSSASNWIGTTGSGSSDRFADLTRGISQFTVDVPMQPEPAPEPADGTGVGPDDAFPAMAGVPEPASHTSWAGLVAVLGGLWAWLRRRFGGLRSGAPRER